MAIISRVRTAWNAFRSSNTVTQAEEVSYGTPTYGGSNQSRSRLRIYNERSLVTSIYARIAIDVAGIEIRHVQLDDEDRYLSYVDSSLDSCFTLEANIDQGPRAFIQDAALSMLDRGAVAIVAVDTTSDPALNSDFDVLSMRVGEIVQWYPRHVKVSLYNEATGKREEVTLPKRNVAIAENPLYAVMNEPNSTLQRLLRKLTLLDAVDEQSSSGKLDIIIQLPYVIKSEARRQAAEKRREEIEFQLKGSQYGIAYTDGTEKITQLNRPAENNLFTQVEYLTKLLYSQLGITEEVMAGTADEKVMLNYLNRTVEPILDAFVQAFQRAFLGKEKTTQKQKIKYFKDPFKLVPLGNLADVVDKLSRNEILSANEFRGIIGFKPSKDPKADQLNNSNMPSTPVAPDPTQQITPPAAVA